MYFTDTIVLSHAPAGEADALISLYTKDYGKIRARAQGVYKEHAKLRGHLETFSFSRIGLVSSRNGERLIYAEALETWPAIREDLERAKAAWYCVTAVDAATLPGERDRALWDVLFEALARLSVSPPDEEFFSRFEARIIERLGYSGADDITILGLPIPRPV